MNGAFSKLNQYIKRLKDNGNIVIKRETLTNMIDCSDVAREDLEMSYKIMVACAALHENGYRSVVRREGLFLDYENANNPLFIQKLVENAEYDAMQKKFIVDALRENRDRVFDAFPEYAQMAFSFDAEHESPVYEEVTTGKLIEMLEQIAI